MLNELLVMIFYTPHELASHFRPEGLFARYRTSAL